MVYVLIEGYVSLFVIFDEPVLHAYAHACSSTRACILLPIIRYTMLTGTLHWKSRRSIVVHTASYLVLHSRAVKCMTLVRIFIFVVHLPVSIFYPK